jgi:hypothetical protein
MSAICPAGRINQAPREVRSGSEATLRPGPANVRYSANSDVDSPKGAEQALSRRGHCSDFDLLGYRKSIVNFDP